MNKYQTLMAFKKLTAKKKMAPSPEKLALNAAKKALKIMARQAYLARKKGLKELKNQSVSIGKVSHESARVFDRQRSLDRKVQRYSKGLC